MAVCNAAGKALDPVIIFGGKNMQSTWKSDKALPKTYYRRSDNGWMTTEIFLGWFQKFSEEVKERPLLLIYDGHLTHISIELIEHARKEDIHIIKFPPHVTDVLQPLDVACIGPLKRKWETMLNERLNQLGASRSRLDKATFVEQLCKVWHDGLKPTNIIAGFESTGIFPVDPSRYPEKRFDTRLLKRYKSWVDAGKPEELVEDLATSISTPSKAKETFNKQTQNKTDAESSLAEASNVSFQSLTEMESPSKSTPVSKSPNNPGPPPHSPPPGYRWQLEWRLVKDSGSLDSGSLNSVSTVTNSKSFEEIILNKIKPHDAKPKPKRSKVDLMAKLVLLMKNTWQP